MTRTMVIGDIHGCYDEFLELLELVGFTSNDRVVSVGDMVDRGPKSMEVVDYFASRPGRCLAVRGNHEQKHLHSRGGKIDSLAGRIVRRTTSADFYAYMLDHLETLPYFIELDEAIVVHAGIEPGIPLAEQDPKVLMGVGSSGRAGFDGKSPWWYDDPRLAGHKPIIFGHEKRAEVVRNCHGNVWGIDTGAAMGGQITGLLLPDFKLFSVPTPDYWSEQKQRWGTRCLAEDLEVLPWRTIFSLPDEPKGWSATEIDDLHGIRNELHHAVGAVECALYWLLRDTGYDALPNEAKGPLMRRLKKEAASWKLSKQLALIALPHGDAEAVVESRFKNWAELKESGLHLI